MELLGKVRTSNIKYNNMHDHDIEYNTAASANPAYYGVTGSKMNFKIINTTVNSIWCIC